MSLQRRDTEDGIRRAVAGIATSFDDLEEETFAIGRRVELKILAGIVTVDFVRLVSIENIHHAMHMRRSSEIADLNVSVIRTVQDIVDRGLRTGVFKRRADAIDVHMLISAFCFFRVSNRYTFGTIFQRDLSDPATYGRHKMMITDAVLSYLQSIDNDHSA